MPESPTAAGFVGLGAMGAPVARRLLEAGVPLVVHNRTREKAEGLVAAGARWAETPRDVGRAATGQTIFTLLSDAKAVRTVLFGRTGLARGAGPGTLIVDLSTVTPEESRSFAERLSRRGIHFMDAPLGGSTDAAAEGRLLVFVGGSTDDLARARPLLDRFARRVELLGPVGAGSSMKLVNNLLSIGHVALAGEALALVQGFGLDRGRAIELLLDGGGESRMLGLKKEAFLRQEYPTRFRLALARKDLGLIDRAARDAGGSARIAREVRRLFDEAIAQGLGERDFAAVLESALARRRGGTPSPETPRTPSSAAPEEGPRTP
jgi:3-hydroxyisobutyrate dehydrogenase